MTVTIDAPVGVAAAVPSRRSLRRGGAWSAANRVIGAIGSLVVLRLGTDSLGSGELGVWLLLWACVPLLGFLDLGVSNAIVSRVAGSRWLGRDDDARITMSTALVVLLVTGGTVVIGGLALLALLDPVSFVKTTAAGHRHLRSGAAIVLLAVALSLPLGLSQRALHACQRVDLASQLGVVANVLQVAIAVAVSVGGGAFGWWVLVVVAPVLLTGMLSWLALLRPEFASVRPSVQSASRDEAWSLVGVGVLYAGVAFAGIVAFETDAIVISTVLGADRVAAFVVPARIFAMIPAVLQMAFLPLWPAVAGAIAHGDHRWARRAFTRATASCGAAAVVVAGATAVVVVPLMTLMAPSVERPGAALLAVLALLAVVQSISVPYAAALSGAEMLRPQLKAAAAMALCNVAMSVVLVHAIGVSGPALATVVTQTAIVLVPLTVVIQRAWPVELVVER